MKVNREAFLHCLESVSPGLTKKETSISLMSVAWRDVLDHEETYRISDSGVIRSKDRICPREYRGDVRRQGQIIKTHQDPRSGYVYVGLYKDNHQNQHLVHRLVWEAFNGRIRKKYQINHKNCIKWDNQLTNLEVMTKSQNLLHASRNGLLKPVRGERHWKAKLNEKSVRMIRMLYASGEFSIFDLASAFGIGFRNISMVINNQTWRHVL